MKNIILITVLTFSITLNAQEQEKIKLITGVRVNPFVLFDNQGNKAEITQIGRAHV